MNGSHLPYDAAVRLRRVDRNPVLEPGRVYFGLQGQLYEAGGRISELLCPTRDTCGADCSPTLLDVAQVLHRNAKPCRKDRKRSVVTSSNPWFSTRCAQNSRPLVFLIAHKGAPSRTRFDAAHELGHLVMHADVVAGSPELERQANRFASAFLVPRDSFLAECPKWLNWPHFYELRRRWKVSVAALVKRAYDLTPQAERVAVFVRYRGGYGRFGLREASGCRNDNVILTC